MANLKPGTLADKIFQNAQDIKQAKVELEKTAQHKKLKKLEDKKKELEKQCLEMLKENDLEGAVGKKGKIAISETTVATISEEKGGWDALYKYIHKNKAYHLLNKAIKQESVRELWADGKVVPGVDKFKNKKLSVRKV